MTKKIHLFLFLLQVSINLAAAPAPAEKSFPKTRKSEKHPPVEGRLELQDVNWASAPPYTLAAPPRTLLLEGAARQPGVFRKVRRENPEMAARAGSRRGEDRRRAWASRRGSETRGRRRWLDVTFSGGLYPETCRGPGRAFARLSRMGSKLCLSTPPRPTDSAKDPFFLVPPG